MGSAAALPMMGFAIDEGPQRFSVTRLQPADAAGGQADVPFCDELAEGERLLDLRFDRNHPCRVVRVHGADSPTIDADHRWDLNGLPVDARVEVGMNVFDGALVAEHRQPGCAHRGRCIGWRWAPRRKCVAAERSGGWWVTRLGRNCLIMLRTNRFRDD